MSVERVPVLIDTDCGVDDAVALWWALTHRRIEIVGFSIVWGNVDVVTAADNVGRILEATNHTTIPIALGLDAPIAAAPPLRRADFIHGSDGLGDTFRPPPTTEPIAEPAVAFLRRLVDERPGELTVVTLGPLSNIAAVLAEDPTWSTRVKRLVAMGGVVGIQGNALPYGEANIAHDPAAAAVVVGARWNEPPLLVGLDVTQSATLTESEFALVSEHKSAAASYLDAPLHFYRTFGGTFAPPGECPCHDLLAVMGIFDEPGEPGLFDAPVLPLSVQAGPGPAWGSTIADRRAPFFAAAGGDSVQEAHDDFTPWRVALGVDVARFRSEVRHLFGETHPHPAGPPPHHRPDESATEDPR